MMWMLIALYCLKAAPHQCMLGKMPDLHKTEAKCIAASAGLVKEPSPEIKLQYFMCQPLQPSKVWKKAG